MLTIDRDKLLTVLVPVAAAAARHAVMPILGMVRIEARDGRLDLAATDLVVWAMAHTPCPDQLAVVHAPARLLTRIVMACAPGPIELDLAVAGNERRLRVRSGRAEFVLRSPDAQDWPACPPMPADVLYAGDVAGRVAGAMVRVAPITSAATDRQFARGVWLASGPNGYAVTAIDAGGHYTAMIRSGNTATPAVCVPRRALAVVNAQIATAQPISIAYSCDSARKVLAFAAGSLAVATQTIEADMPDVNTVSIDQAADPIVCCRVALLAACKRIGVAWSLVIERRLEGLRVTCTGVDNSASEVVEATGNSLAVPVGLVVDQLLKVLGALTSANVAITAGAAIVRIDGADGEIALLAHAARA